MRLSPSLLPRGGAPGRRPASRVRRALIAAAGAVVLAAGSLGLAAAPAGAAADPDLGPNVTVFDPSMSVAQIQAKVDAIAAAQVSNEFGPQRYALLFKPGTYGSATEPLNFQVGYYTQVAGLGLTPGDVVINGSVYVRNQCKNNSCTALDNFWRSLENVTINVTTPNFGCYTGQFWAVSQAAPLRRVDVHGQVTLMDYCTGPSFASGGFIADSRFDGVVINGSQQQWMTRDSQVGTWTNGVWNQVFSGVVGAPGACFPAAASCGGPYTVVAKSPVTQEKPFLYVDSQGAWKVFVPALRRNSSGVSWASGTPAGRSIPLSDFTVAKPGMPIDELNEDLAEGDNLLLTPGQYSYAKPLRVKRTGTVVLGLGLPSITPTKGDAALTVADVTGVDVAGLTVDAGPVLSPVLMQVGSKNAHKGSADAPVVLHDVFFRVGGPAAGKAGVNLEVNSDFTILDNTWIWRADHGNGVGWTVNTSDTGLVVNGDDVTAYGLFVEHHQKTEVIWNGERGNVIFFQNEMPYDPPSQAAWNQAPGVEGYPALTVSPGVKAFSGTGMGSYSFFNQGIDVFASNAFTAPSTLPKGSLTNLLTIFLDPGKGKGGIRNVVNGIGGSSTIANPDVPVTVVSYP